MEGIYRRRDERKNTEKYRRSSAVFARSAIKIRDQAMLEFDAFAYNSQFGNGESNYCFVQKLMSGLNRHLPNGFELVLHPTGTDFESR